MPSRRDFLRMISQTGLATASAPLWLHETSAKAFAEVGSSYKAMVVVTLSGGNDANNMLIPLDSAEYSQYTSLRTSISIPQSSCIPLSSSGGAKTFGLHPSLSSIGSLYNNGNALVVANVGPLSAPATKTQLALMPQMIPQGLLSHPAGIAQWESASTVELPTTGWGGRIADLIVSQSGSLPPVFNAGLASIFTVGRSVQGIVVGANSAPLTPLPDGISSAILAIAQNDAKSANALVSQAASLRVQATNQQILLSQAQNAGSTLATQFPQTSLGQAMKSVAAVINGRSVIGASRQIFYCQQGQYDTHQGQLPSQSALLAELDGGIGAFMTALQEMGLPNDVLVCTHSDFNRTFVANVTAGTDHAWGSHQLIIGGGIKGGRIIGDVPEPEIGGSLDLNGYGTWIPTLSVTQMTAGIGAWMGLSESQLVSVFPDLPNFSQGAISLS